MSNISHGKVKIIKGSTIVTGGSVEELTSCRYSKEPVRYTNVTLCIPTCNYVRNLQKHIRLKLQYKTNHILAVFPYKCQRSVGFQYFMGGKF